MDIAHRIGKCVIDSTVEFGIRSNKRTNVIHQTIASIIEELNPNLKCKIEHNLKIATGSYDVDIVAFRDDKIVLMVSVKANMNNIKQNKTNNQNVKGGELLKMYNGAPGSKIVFLDVIPSECPYYETDGRIKCMETFKPEEVRSENAQLLKILSPEGSPLSAHIFTIITKNNYGLTREIPVQYVDVVDFSDMERFTKLIQEL